MNLMENIGGLFKQNDADIRNSSGCWLYCYQSIEDGEVARILHVEQTRGSQTD